jgi:hypothetical protein
MGILTNIVAASDDDIAALCGSLHPIDDWDGIERRDIDATKLAVFHSLVTGDELGQALYLYEPICDNEAGLMVVRIADFVVERLVAFDEEALECIAIKLAATEEFELTEIDLDEVHDWVLAMAALAQLASSQDLSLFAWMHPLQT